MRCGCGDIWAVDALEDKTGMVAVEFSNGGGEGAAALCVTLGDLAPLGLEVVPIIVDTYLGH